MADYHCRWKFLPGSFTSIATPTTNVAAAVEGGADDYSNLTSVLKSLLIAAKCI